MIEKPTQKPKAVILLSGGIDSTIALYTALNKGFDAYCLTFDYGQRCREELSRSATIAKTLKSNHVILQLDLSPAFQAGVTDPSEDMTSKDDVTTYEGLVKEAYFPARNLIFCAVAVAYAEAIGALDIFTGLYQATSAPDGGKDFCRAIEKAAGVSTVNGREGKKYTVHSFHNKIKEEMLASALEEGMDLSDTISCLSSVNGKPCGMCYQCNHRRFLFERLGMTDPAELSGEL